MRRFGLLTIWLLALSAPAAAQLRPGALVRLYDVGQAPRALPELAPGQPANEVRVVDEIDLRLDRGDFGALRENFYTRVDATLTIEQAGEYVFELTSDDGARLYIDDQLVIDHDGLHGPTPKEGRTTGNASPGPDGFLAAGQHALRIEHFQGGGSAQLTLLWRRPVEPEFTPIPAQLLGHDASLSRETAPGVKRTIPPLRKGRPGDGGPVAGMHPAFRIDAPGAEATRRAEDALRRASVGSTIIAAGVLARAAAAPGAAWIETVEHEAGPRVLAWLPGGQGVDRPGAPCTLQAGPMAEQLLVPDERTGAMHRVAVDRVGDVAQGCVFRFAATSQGVAALAALDGGGFAMALRFAHEIPNGDVTIAVAQPVDAAPFEMRAARALANGLEIEFTKPLRAGIGWEADAYYIEQWPLERRHEGTRARRHEGQDSPGATAVSGVPAEAGGANAEDTAHRPVAHAGNTAHRAVAHVEISPPRRDGVRYPVKSASVSEDRRRVFLEIDSLKPSHVVYIRLLPPCLSEDDELPWSTEAWYTLNAVPTDRRGEVRTPPRPEPQNLLTEAEKAEGWRLLFDGETTIGWRGFRKAGGTGETPVPPTGPTPAPQSIDAAPAPQRTGAALPPALPGWQVIDGCLVRTGPGGDIITTGQFGDFELKLEWRVGPGGNSGVFFRVTEDQPAVYMTGPEMQVLDNTEHADGRNPLTSAASNYALHAPVRDVTRPVGLFNTARLLVRGPHVEHWLNGEKVLEYELWSPEWRSLVQASKFRAWPQYGLNKRGHIALQDHGDRVWFRNIKIRELGRHEGEEGRHEGT